MVLEIALFKFQFVKNKRYAGELHRGHRYNAKTFVLASFIVTEQQKTVREKSKASSRNGYEGTCSDIEEFSKTSGELLSSLCSSESDPVGTKVDEQALGVEERRSHEPVVADGRAEEA